MIKKDFKQKYFLYCNDCKVEKLINKFGSLNNSSYICRIKIISNE
jgi:hypothetical protein